MLEAQQAHTLAEQARVEGELRDLPEDDEYLLKRRALDQERTHLINLQNNISERIELLDSIDKAQQAIHTATGGDSLARKLDEIVKLWEQERDSASRQRAHWKQLYAAMEQAVNKKNPQPSAPRKGSSKKPTSQAVPVSRPAPPSARASGPDDTWAYNVQADSAIRYGQPRSSAPELRRDNNSGRGKFMAYLASRDGFHGTGMPLQ